jgi:hypothetical protein
MDRFTGRDGAFDFVEEADEFLMSVALHILPQDCSVGHIKGGKQCRRPVAFIVALVPSPSAVERTISARQTCFCGELPSETIPESRSWSAGETVIVIPVRMPQTRTADNKWEFQTGLFCLNISTKLL